jgi:hypothetical protein
MSNALAIAAVTATLRSLIIRGVPDLPNGNVTTKALDKARSAGASPNQINIFLYQILPNAGWRNMDLARQVRPGETGQPPLALNLYYLITAFGQDDDETLAHQWLGRAMSVLHDHSLLGASEIKDATTQLFPTSDLDVQTERLRIALQPMPMEEMSRLWTALQGQYRLSAAYEVTVVLIESTRQVSAPLPVLQRGAGDQGVFAVASPSPSITSVQPDVQPPNTQPSVRLGDALIIKGQHLDTGGISVRFTRQPVPAGPALAETITIAPLGGGREDELRVQLPAPSDPGALANWAPGFYTVSLVVAPPNLPSWTTAESQIKLAPTITVAAQRAAAGDLVTITCTPRLRDKQQVMVLFDGVPLLAPPQISTPADTAKPTSVQFAVPAVNKASYVVRLRVDGVDSLPVITAGTAPVLQFDDSQKITVI